MELPAFVCSTCGRTDLPPAGDWDPPICLECDAAINADAERAFETSREDDEHEDDDEGERLSRPSDAGRPDRARARHRDGHGSGR